MTEVEVNGLLREIMREAVGVQMTFTQKGGATFTVYAKSLNDAEQMVVFMQKLVEGITEKVRAKIEGVSQ